MKPQINRAQSNTREKIGGNTIRRRCFRNLVGKKTFFLKFFLFSHKKAKTFCFEGQKIFTKPTHPL